MFLKSSATGVIRRCRLWVIRRHWIDSKVCQLRSPKRTSRSTSFVGPETADLDVVCRVCGAPFPGREDGLVLKYFLLRKAARVDPRVRRILQRARPKDSQ